MNTSADKKIRVLLTVSNNRLSGIEQFAVLLAAYLDKERFDVMVGVPIAGSYCDVLRRYHVNFFLYNNRHVGRISLNGLVTLFLHMIRHRYDIVHANAGITPCIIGRLLGIRLVIESKHGLDFTAEQLDSMKPVRLAYERAKRLVVDMAVTDCERDRAVLIRNFRYDPVKVFAVYNGIERRDQIVRPAGDGRFVVGTIGRLSFQKGQEYLIAAAKILKDRGLPIRYQIYGSGDKREMLEALIRQHNLEADVFLMGYTTDVDDVLATFDLFALPSRYEGIPYILVQAMQARVPVIITDVGGVSEIVKDMVNGILIRKEDEVALAEKIMMLYNDRDLRQRLATNARRDFDENYTIEKNVTVFEKLYDSGLTGR